ncbi:MAG: orotidine-5'-phosphate decarboxylase [Candidatus Gastranaerophilales bacterium]|nr:orotidine-5'-phosphate decarboxylase [Candidatus Gastranaerophilales bacterium]
MTIKRPKSSKDRIVLALDVDTLEEVEQIVKELKDYVGFFKVGLQLIASTGFDSIDIIKNNGGKVFLDSKFHDIPNTVAKASVNLLRKGVDFFNLHIQGGSKMISSTVKLTREYAKKNNIEQPTILGVTLLSSFGQKTLTEELNVNLNIDDYVANLTKIAINSGINGVVASSIEAKEIRKTLDDDFIIMCPAVRPTWSCVNDQIRVLTPKAAINYGVDYLIVGRPIICAENRIVAANLIIDEIEEACSVEI